MFATKKLASLLIYGSLAWSGLTYGDAVTDWNEITMTAVSAARPGPQGMLDVALVHIAVHDAVQAIEKRYEPYHFEMSGAKGSRTAAVAAAAHAVLISIYPTQASSIDAAYYDYVANKGLNGDPGLDVGQRAAASIVPLRRATPNPLPPPFVGGTDIGMWRPTESFLGNPPAPPSLSPMVTPWLADTNPFTMTSPRRFRADPPPALTTDRYRRDYDEVKMMGALQGSARSPEQTDLAYFYNDNFFTQWNRVLRGVAVSRVDKVGDSARLFALANMAAADALITAWDSKKHYYFWRPITAIREGEFDGNPGTSGDPSWQPLINTPNYPDYTSGANALVGSMTRILGLFLGSDKGPFEVTSLSPLAVKKSRWYVRFSDAADDVVEARIYLGIHFRFADTSARRQGERVAGHAFRHFLLPLRSGNHRDGGHEEKN